MGSGGSQHSVLAWLGSMLIHVNASGVSPRGWEIIPREVEQSGLGQELCSEYQQLSPVDWSSHAGTLASGAPNCNYGGMSNRPTVPSFPQPKMSRGKGGKDGTGSLSAPRVSAGPKLTGTLLRMWCILGCASLNATLMEKEVAGPEEKSPVAFY